MRLTFIYIFIPAILLLSSANGLKCVISPLGEGHDDTDQVNTAVKKCGHFGSVVLREGSYNITRKMTWDLKSSRVDLFGTLNFRPDVEYWLNETSTYRVVFIQNQASWFVVTGSDFVIDAHDKGGIQGNGQPWWNYFQTHQKQDGDGRPISLTLWRAKRALVKNFRIEAPPFYCNTVAESQHIIYDGMYCNATNTNPAYAGKNVVPNTDGICTYRSDNVRIKNWDITLGDDCLAIKANSTNIHASNVTCRGGNGVAFGSVGQYAELSDQIDNVLLEDILVTRIDSNVQPNMGNGIYFKSWTGTVNGSPPIGGGGGPGFVRNVIMRNIRLDRVNIPTKIYQTNGGKSGDLPSQLKFSNLTYVNWTGTSLTNTIVNFDCSPAVGCSDIRFSSFNITGPLELPSKYLCRNVAGLTGLEAPCTTPGTT